MKNQEDPILALCKKDPKGYLFYALLEEFKAEIGRHQERTGITDAWTGRLRHYANRHIDGLRRHRTSLDEATEHFREMWESLGRFKGIEATTEEYIRLQQKIDIDHDRNDCGAWMIKDFLVTTPLRLEERADKQYSNMMSAIKDEADLVTSKLWDLELRGGRDRISLARKSRQEQKRIDKKSWMYHLSFYDEPHTIITAAFESFMLKYTEFDRRDYSETYTYFDAELSQEEDKYFRRRMESFVKAIKKHEGDLTGMASVIAKHLCYKADCAGGSRGMYIDPFYPTDFTAIKFPSAQADFVAARLIAAQAERTYSDKLTGKGTSK